MEALGDIVRSEGGDFEAYFQFGYSVCPFPSVFVLIVLGEGLTRRTDLRTMA
jgi:hypothetical protein